MKKYFYLAKAGFMQWAAYRVGFIFSIISNIIFLFITYYLWRAIYGTPGKVLNGMTFEQTFLYLAVGSSVMVILSSDIDWVIGYNITSGDIVIHLNRPTDFQLAMLARSGGHMISRFILLSVPALFFIIFVFKAQIPVGINLLFFMLALVLSFFINFYIDFMAGVMTFYTQSMWGIFFSKGVIIALLSGATIPVSFFPYGFQKVVMLLPFQAIYNIPLKILTTKGIGISEYISMMLVQLIWMAVLLFGSRLFYNKSLKVITVNGG